MTTQHLIEHFIKVGWHHITDQIENLLIDASKHNMPYSEFLNILLLHEIEKEKHQFYRNEYNKRNFRFINQFMNLVLPFNLVLVNSE